MASSVKKQFTFTENLLNHLLPILMLLLDYLKLLKLGVIFILLNLKPRGLSKAKNQPYYELRKTYLLPSQNRLHKGL
jgi:hypothetical protein